MLAHLGPAPPAQGTDLIAQAVGAWALATSGGHAAGHASAQRRRHPATSRSGNQREEDGRDDRGTSGSAAAAAGSGERPVVPTGAPGRTGRLALLPLRHAARTAAAASRLSRAGAGEVAARTAEQVFATLGELKGGAAKLGQAMSVFEAALPEEVAAPYRSALRRLTDAAPAMPAEVARRVVAADLAAVYGPGWQERLVAFDDIPAAAASIGQVHRGKWRIDGGQVVEVAVKVQYPGVGQALRSDLRQGLAAGAGDGPAHQAQRVRAGGRIRWAHRRGAGLRARGASPGAGRGRVRGPPASRTRRRPRRRGTGTAGRAGRGRAHLSTPSGCPATRRAGMYRGSSGGSSARA
jgi:ABC1 atypical kinase-like domain